MPRSLLRIIPFEGNVAISLGVIRLGSGIIPISVRMAPDSDGMVRREARKRTRAVAECI